MNEQLKKIKAVKKLDNNKYTNEEEYYLDEESGVIYDIEFKYPLGKIYFDEDGIPELLKSNVYIVSESIPIPVLKNN